MSEQEMLKGKARIFERKEGEPLEDYMRRFYLSKNVDFKEVENGEDLMENFHEDFYRNAVYVNDAIYEVIEKYDYEDFDIFEANKNNDGTIDFTLSFYNGACCLNEALEIALKKLIK